MNDAEVLRKCINAFQREYIETTGIETFHRSITVPGACMSVFRTHFLQEKTIGILDNQTTKTTAHSKKSMYWLIHRELEDGVIIQHARNGGETKVGRFLVDGYCEDTDTVYEFFGCFWHGCIQCYSRSTMNSKTGKTMGEMYDATQRRLQDLKGIGKKIVYIWEIDWDRLAKDNEDIERIVKNFPVVEPLLPGEAFYGGRTDAIRQEYNHEIDGGKVRYLDYMSLYPSVNKYTMYPVGFPQILTGQEASRKLIGECFGLVKAKVLPPRNLFMPVLPYRHNGKLYFPLCRTCTEGRSTNTCTHSEEDRSLEGAWVSTELQEAVDQGYKVIQVCEVWHWEERSDQLFREYVDTFLRTKMEASEWPSNADTDESKAAYIQRIKETEGVCQ